MSHLLANRKKKNTIKFCIVKILWINFCLMFKFQLDEENGMQQFAGECLPQSRRQIPPSLPPAPPDMTPKQLKRRMIVAAIVHSENNYVATLQRLVNVSIIKISRLSPHSMKAVNKVIWFSGI